MKVVFLECQIIGYLLSLFFTISLKLFRLSINCRSCHQLCLQLSHCFLPMVLTTHKFLLCWWYILPSAFVRLLQTRESVPPLWNAVQIPLIFLSLTLLNMDHKWKGLLGAIVRSSGVCGLHPMVRVERKTYVPAFCFTTNQQRVRLYINHLQGPQSQCKDSRNNYFHVSVLSQSLSSNQFKS